MRGQPAILIVVLATLGIFAMTGGPASASCIATAPGTVPYRSGVVFVGTVVATQHRGTTARVVVEDVWRGPDLAHEVTVVGGPGREDAATSVDRNYSVGVRYVFAPDGDGTPFHDNACTATAPYADVAALRPAGHPDLTSAPIPSEQGGTTRTRAVLAGGVLALMGLVVLRLRRRRVGIAQPG